MRFRVLLLVVFVIGTLLGCATANQNVGKVLVAACGGCAVLQDSGACVATPAPAVRGMPMMKEAAPSGTALPPCVAPKQLWLVNFGDVMDKKAAPKLECR